MAKDITHDGGRHAAPATEQKTPDRVKRIEAAGGPEGRGDEEGVWIETTHTWSTGAHGADPSKQVATRPGGMGKGAEEPTGG